MLRARTSLGASRSLVEHPSQRLLPDPDIAPGDQPVDRRDRALLGNVSGRSACRTVGTTGV